VRLDAEASPVFVSCAQRGGWLPEAGD